MRTSIYYDNIDNVSEILAKFFNRYTDSHILEWCLNKNIIDINNIKNNILRPKDRNFQRNGEWDVLIHETHYPIFNDSSRVDLTPAFNIIDLGISQTSIPLSVYIKNSLIQPIRLVEKLDPI
ncbi:hypothetical protein RhiirB3_468951 [Rhizophagus irregularis]|nr:hypothetical protein RhiirB3_468951 [Rhizophagus irregularis]